MATRLKHAVKVAALLTSSIVLCAVTAEVTVRVLYGQRFGPRPRFYEADDHLGWKPAPRLHHDFYGSDFSMKIRTDADGYRLGELGDVDYTKDLVILCGDSYSFGWGVSTEESFASHLDKSLSDASDGRVRVVNLGVGGYGILQSCDRLDDFFRRHPGAHVRLVLLQHSVNDATDNYHAIGYHLGLWKTEDVDSKGSWFHLVNLGRYLLLTRASADAPVNDEGAGDPYAQDLLWSYRRTGDIVLYPKRVTIGMRTLTFDTATLKADFSPDSLLQRKKLVPIQRDLMFESLNCIHAAAKSQGAVVVHTFIATTPEWYVHEVADLARQSANFVQCPVTITPAMPPLSEFAGPTNNAHSGRHFNPAFNEFWAARMAEYLIETQSATLGVSKN
jgi:hypothetical protein